MRTTARLVPLALLGSLALTGCSMLSSEDATFEGDSAQSTTQPDADAGQPEPDTGTGADDAVETDADTAGGDGSSAVHTTADVIGVTPVDPDDVVADAMFTLPGTNDEVRIGIESLVHDGSTTELRLVLTPMFVGGGNGLSSARTMLATDEPALVDRTNLKTYRPIYRANWHDAEAAQGESIRFQFFFAPPQDDISALDVQISSSWPVFEDVPLTSGE